MTKEKKLERCFVMIKTPLWPEVNIEDRTLEVFAELDALAEECQGSQVSAGIAENAPIELFEQLYSVHKGKYFYDWLVDSNTGKTVYIAVYEGEDIINAIRTQLGDTNPAEAEEWTIRGREWNGKKTSEQAKQEKRTTDNIAHASDSEKNAEYEISTFQDYLSSYYLRHE